MHNTHNHTSRDAICTWQEVWLWDCTLDPSVPYCWYRGSQTLGSLCISKKQGPAAGGPRGFHNLPTSGACETPGLENHTYHSLPAPGIPHIPWAGRLQPYPVASRTQLGPSTRRHSARTQCLKLQDSGQQPWGATRAQSWCSPAAGSLATC